LGAIAFRDVAKNIAPKGRSYRSNARGLPRVVHLSGIWPDALISGFGASGYVVLFEVEGAKTVTVLAVRHQREDDCR
jgi:plasmid stabilization system protein ParE